MQGFLHHGKLAQELAEVLGTVRPDLELVREVAELLSTLARERMEVHIDRLSDLLPLVSLMLALTLAEAACLAHERLVLRFAAIP